ARRLDVPGETGEGEWLEPVVAVRVGALRALREKLAQSLGLPERRGLEDVQVRALGQQLGDAFVVTAVERFQEFRHQRRSFESLRSFRIRPPVWHSGQ